jgi:hypothetical protein
MMSDRTRTPPTDPTTAPIIVPVLVPDDLVETGELVAEKG